MVQGDMEVEMTAAAITAKGQITIPATVRATLGVDTGDCLEFVEVAKGRFEIVAATQPITASKGLIPRSAKPVSIEAMNATGTAAPATATPKARSASAWWKDSTTGSESSSAVPMAIETRRTASTRSSPVSCQRYPKTPICTHTDPRRPIFSMM